MSSLSKWTSLGDWLRIANFHRLLRLTTSQVTLTNGSWRKGELRLSKSDGIVIWISEALHKDTGVEEDVSRHADGSTSSLTRILPV